MRLLATFIVATYAILPHGDCTAGPLTTTKTPRDVPVAAAKPIRVEAAWIRAAPPGAMTLSGYMVMRNDGTRPVRFKSAQSDGFGMVELHRSLVVNGVSMMRPAGAQSIPPGGSLQFEPGGLHLMLMQPNRELKIGDKVRFQLNFDDGVAVDVVAQVSADPPTATTH